MRVVVPIEVWNPCSAREVLPEESELEVFLIVKGKATFTVGTMEGEYEAPVVDILLSCVEEK